MEALFGKIAEKLITGKEDEVKSLVKEALAKDANPREILDNGLLAGMDVVGKRFKDGDMFIPEVIQSARCMHGSMDILNPLFAEGDAADAGTVVIGTVEGDIHDIGKNIVAMMLQGVGFKVIDLGTNIKPQDFVKAVKEHNADIVGMSALLTTTMPKMGKTIEALEEAGVRDQVKIMVGGAPVTQNFVDKIGGDAYGANAAIASEKAKALLT